MQKLFMVMRGVQRNTRTRLLGFGESRLVERAKNEMTNTITGFLFRNNTDTRQALNIRVEVDIPNCAMMST